MFERVLNYTPVLSFSSDVIGTTNSKWQLLNEMLMLALCIMKYQKLWALLKTKKMAYLLRVTSINIRIVGVKENGRLPRFIFTFLCTFLGFVQYGMVLYWINRWKFWLKQNYGKKNPHCNSREVFYVLWICSYSRKNILIFWQFLQSS